MNYLIIISIIFLTTLNGFGQYIYLTEDKEEIEKKFATYYHDYYEINGKYVDSIFYLNGQPYEIIELKSLYPRIKDGKYRLFYPSGELHYDIDYKNGAKHGFMTGYYKSGKILRKDFYENDSLISGHCFNLSGQDTIYFPHLIIPKFNYQRITDFKDFINNNLEYPIEAAEQGISGRVVAQFLVDTNGYVTEVKIKSTTNLIFNESAYKAIKNSPRWEPALQDGKKVKYYMSVPISYYVNNN